MDRSAPTWADGAPIKTEPLDDITTSIDAPLATQMPPPGAGNEESLFLEDSARNIFPKRVLQPDGERWATACCDQPHASHPHHHLLVCGHDIVTDEVTGCVRNCMPSKDKRGNKPKYSSFQCPAIGCPQRVGAFRELDSRTGRYKPGRTCRASHVYGRDATLDEQRRREKEDGGRMVRRKRSASPEPKATATRPKESIDLAEALNKELKESTPAERRIMMNLRGRGTRNIVNGRYETEKDKLAAAKDAGIVKSLNTLRVASKRELHERQKRATKAALATNSRFAIPDSEVGEAEAEQEVTVDQRRDLLVRCHHCLEAIFDVRHHCFHCDEYDLCTECFMRGHHSHPQHHKFKALQRPKIQFESQLTKFEEVATVCSCDTVYDDFLVLCRSCDSEFHPGCFGQGRYGVQTYEDRQDFWREKALRYDWNRWVEGKVHQCERCRAAVTPAISDPPSALTERALRAKRNIENKKQKELQDKRRFSGLSHKQRIQAKAQQLSKALNDNQPIEHSLSTDSVVEHAATLVESGRVTERANDSRLSRATQMSEGAFSGSPRPSVGSSDFAAGPNFHGALAYRTPGYR